MKKFVIILLMIGSVVISAQEKFRRESYREEGIIKATVEAQSMDAVSVKHDTEKFGHKKKKVSDKAKFSSGVNVHPHKFPM